MDLFDKISELGKRRGIYFPSFEIYGGVSGFFDYGPIGSKLKRNIENKWRQLFVNQEEMVELESTVIMPEQAFLASGHLAHFTDFETKCIRCGRAYRVDSLLNELGVKCSEGLQPKDLDSLIQKKGACCPECGGSLSRAEPFNLMFQMKIGSIERGQTGYGRPEAGQGQFVDFKRIYASERERLPLGIAQIGRCLRNEIAPRKGPIRLREFTIIDYEIFFDPEAASYPRIQLLYDQKLRILTAEEQKAGTSRVRELTVKEVLDAKLVLNEILCYFMTLAVKFLEDLGIPPEKQRLREQLPDERAHYSEQTFDQEVWLERWGWTEVSGHAYRMDYDLRNHMAHSGVDLRVYKPFLEPRKIIRIDIEPLMKQIVEDFGVEEGKRTAQLLVESDPLVIEREMQKNGFYEITGEYPKKIRSKHINLTRHEVIEAGRYFLPHVVEPSFGIDRIFYTVLEYAYTEQAKRIILRLPRDISAVSASVFPLVRKDGLPEFAEIIHRHLINENLLVKYDDSGSIGRRYARADEIGIPICITIDYQSLEDNTVTLRDIFTWKQVRVKVSDLPMLLRSYLRKKMEFNELGTTVKPK